ncbi:dihydroxyacetone kinase phosphoryl donor subunit DhaM [Lentibacillus salinarum]|uniref:phosphoenolpyruvate--glycerone phosphotransferase n=1 Tax=Lentibacillus salinarum TaxID=446820 RepID=A0ABW3ZU16_9BACI
MSYVGIVLISHSPKIVEGTKDLIRQVIKEVPIEIAGGTDDGAIGTNVEMVQQAIERANDGEGVSVFYDIGSAKMNAEMAIEMIGEEDVKLMGAPLVEGSYVAAVESGMGKDVQRITAALANEFG